MKPIRTIALRSVEVPGHRDGLVSHTTRTATLGLVAVLLVLLGLPQQGAAATSGSDGFEDDQVGITVAGNFYTLSSCGTTPACTASSVVAKTGTRSALMYTAGDGANFLFGADICDNPSTIQFSVYMTALPTQAGAWQAHHAQGGIAFNQNGVVQMVRYASGSPSYVSFPTAQTWAINTWYDVTIETRADVGETDLCDGTGAKWRVTFATVTGELQQPVATGSNGLVIAADTFAGGNHYIDDLSFVGRATVVSSQSYVVPATTITGFDAHPFFQVGIARYANQNVATFDPQNLAPGQLATESTPNCGSIGGVMAYQKGTGSTYVGYTNCLPGGNAEKLKIRSSVLLDPDVSGTACAINAGMCGDYTLTTEEGIPVVNECVGQSTHAFPPSLVDLGNIQNIPISYEKSAIFTDGVTADKASVGFAYINSASTAAAGGGRFGVWVHTRSETGTHVSCGLEVGFTSPNQQTQLCTWRDPIDSKDYAIAASLGGGSAVYQIQVDTRDGATSYDYGPVVTITQVAQLPTPWSKLQAVDCGGRGIGAEFTASKDAIVQNDLGQVYRLKVIGGPVTAKWGPVPGTATARSVSWSGDGKWFSYVSGTSVVIGNATNGNVVAAAAKPAGTWNSVFMHDTGQSLLTVTSTRVDRFDIYTETTINPVSAGTRCNPVTGNCTVAGPDGAPLDAGDGATSGPVGGGLPGVNTAAFSAAMGITSEAGGWLLGLLFIAAMAAGFYFTMGRSTVLGGLGGFVGMGATVAFGLLPLWVILVIVLLGATVLVLRLRGGGA